MTERGTDAGPRAPARKAAFTPWTRTRARARRAGFLRQFDEIAGPDGLTTLAQEGHDAHRVSDELHVIAQNNTPATAKALGKARRRHRIIVGLATIVLLVSLVWIADDVIGYVTASHERGTALSGQSADCFSTGAAQVVWKAAPPFGSAFAYRCGADARGILISGPISVGALVLAAGAFVVLVIASRKRRRRAWY